MSSTETVDLCSNIGLAVGGGSFVALFFADLSAWDDERQPSIPTPFHTLAVLAIICVVLSCVAMKLGAWNARRQQRHAVALAAEIRAAITEQYGVGYTDGLAKRPPARVLHLVPDQTPDAG